LRSWRAPAAATAVVDLQVLNCKPTITSCNPNCTITYEVVIRNAGDTAAPNFSTGLYYDLPGAFPTCSTPADFNWLQLGGLAAGATATLTHTRANVSPFPSRHENPSALVDRTCAVAESQENNNVPSGGYVVYLGVDLWIKSFMPSVSGSTVTYSLELCNNPQATSYATAPTAYLWENLATLPSGCPAPAGQNYVFNYGSIAPASCKTMYWARTLMLPGTYKAVAFADPTCTISEWNETNNARSTTYTVLPPNFQVQALGSSGSGGTVNYTATVCNTGAATAVPFKVGLYYDRATAPACAAAPDYTWTVNGLAAGGCSTLTYTRTSAPQGNYTGWALADSGCGLTETSETDNAKSTSYAVNATQPDLFIGSFTQVVSAGSASFTAVVCNAGVATTASALVGIYYDRTAAPTTATAADYTHTLTGGLAANACATIQHTRTATPAGSYTAWVLADRSNLVTEYNENNNAESVAYTVAPSQTPDLAVSSLSVTSSGGTVTYTAQICNSGQAAATASTAALFYDAGAAPTCLDGPSATVAVGPLAVGACETKIWTQTGVVPGSYTAWVLADSTCGLIETSETNNATSKAYEVSSIVAGDASVGDLSRADQTAAGDRPAAAGDRPATAGDGQPRTDGPAAGDRSVTPGADKGTTAKESSGCSCEVARRSPGGGLALLVLGLLLALRRRRP
jgi:MYXO-CTERM domain-containing protein